MTDGAYLGHQAARYLGGLTKKYLDGLVVETAKLGIIMEHPEKNRSGAFLKELPPHLIGGHIEDTIREKVIDSIEDGELYVFALPYGFGYQKRGAAVSALATRFNDAESGDAPNQANESSLEQTIKHILNSAKEAKRERRKFSINVLFYDEPSQKTFNEKIKPVLDVSEILDLKVPGYGTIQLYKYWVPSYSKT